MSRDDQIDDLLVRFEDALAAGSPLTPEQLCRDCPDLLPDLLAALENMRAADAFVGASIGADTDGSDELPADLGAGRYQLLTLVDVGGQGAVYSARDSEVGRMVAVKVLHEDIASYPGVAERFRFEAEVIGLLDHPGVVPIYGLGQSPAGRPYYAMRFFKSPTLAAEIKDYHAGAAGGAEREIKFRRLLRAFTAVCETLAYAHARGVVHRDLKPQNIMLGQYGETLVLDWGLAKRVGVADPDLTVEPGLEPLKLADPVARSFAGAAKGTWSYMPPEQARGEWDRVGPASDVFGLGATLYAILTGRPPYEGPDREERAKTCRFDPPRRGRADVPRPLEAVCLKAMAARPEDRYAGAQELARDVERYLADEPVSAWREPLPVRARRWARRHRTLLTVAAAALAVAAATTSAAALVVAEKNSQLKLANRNLEDSLEANRDELYVTSVNLAHREWAGGNLDAVRLRLDACLADRRGWEWRYLDRLTRAHLSARPIHYTGTLNTTSGLAISRDGRRLAAIVGTRARVWDLAAGGEIPSPQAECTGPTLATSRDGRLLAVAVGDRSGKGDVEVWDLETAKPLWHLGVGGAGRAAFSADGKWFAVEGLAPHKVFILEARTGKRRDNLVDLPDSRGTGAVMLALSPDGGLLAVADWGRSVGVWDVATGRRILELDGHARVVAFNPNGRQLVTAADEARVWDLKSGTREHRLAGHAGPISDVSFSPDGRLVATAGWDQTSRVWDAQTGREVRTIRGHTSVVLAAALPDAAHLVTATAFEVKVWDITTDQDARTIAVPPVAGGLSALSLSPDGSKVAGATSRGDRLLPEEAVVRVWGADDGRELASVRKPQAVISALTFSPDGRQFAGVCYGRGLDNVHVTAWDAGTGREVFTARVEGRTDGLTFSPDGRYLAAAGLSGARVWEVASGKIVAETGGGKSEALHFVWVSSEPGGERFLVADWSGHVRPWDWRRAGVLGALPPDTREVAHLPRADDVFAFTGDGSLVARAEFLPSGRSVVHTVHTGGTAKGTDLSTAGRESRIRALAFSPDGSRLVSAGNDGVVNVWNARTGRELLALRCRDRFVNLVAFSADGRRVAAASHSFAPGEPNRITIWTADPAAP